MWWPPCQRILKTLVEVSKHRNTVFMSFESQPFSNAILWYLWKHTMVWKCIVMYFMLNKLFLSPESSVWTSLINLCITLDNPWKRYNLIKSDVILCKKACMWGCWISGCGSLSHSFTLRIVNSYLFFKKLKSLNILRCYWNLQNLTSLTRKLIACKNKLTGISKLWCLDDWTLALGSKNSVGVLFMDLSKALDCLSHATDKWASMDNFMETRYKISILAILWACLFVSSPSSCGKWIA